MSHLCCNELHKAHDACELAKGCTASPQATHAVVYSREDDHTDEVQRDRGKELQQRRTAHSTQVYISSSRQLCMSHIRETQATLMNWKGTVERNCSSDAQHRQHGMEAAAVAVS